MGRVMPDWDSHGSVQVRLENLQDGGLVRVIQGCFRVCQGCFGRLYFSDCISVCVMFLLRTSVFILQCFLVLFSWFDIPDQQGLRQADPSWLPLLMERSFLQKVLQRKNFHLPIDSDRDKSPSEAKIVHVRAERWEGSIMGLVLELLLSRQTLLFVLVY